MTERKSDRKARKEKVDEGGEKVKKEKIIALTGKII